jgi:aminocarboxymuconate-semialdehyde decarboxylase
MFQNEYSPPLVRDKHGSSNVTKEVALHKFAQGTLRVDFHTHFIPEHLPALGEKYSDEGWPTLIHNASCQADIYFAGKHYRRIDDRSWDLQRRLKDMAVEGVDVQVLSPIPVTFAYDFSAQGALELAQMQNEEIAEAVAASPEHFIGLVQNHASFSGMTR